MCGIAGIVAFSEPALPYLACIEAATQTLRRRGPDNQSVYRHNRVALGHARLSVIDTSINANQPLFDPLGQYAIIFNGEIFNYRLLKEELAAEGVVFATQSDTEVLLRGYMHWGVSVLTRLNGFFAFAIYHLPTQTLFLARDRFGVKPLLYYADATRLVFASEMKALLACQIPKLLDHTSLYAYLQLNYVPPPYTMLQQVQHLPPGCCLTVNVATGALNQAQYYQIPCLPEQEQTPVSYEAAQKQLRQLLDDAVRLRLTADVPLGAFLSGGIDSSVIVALASGHTRHLNTFSIGFKDEPLFNETAYARLVAEKYQTNHTEFLLQTDDLRQHLTDILDYLDEPFADTSALAVYILSQYTRKKVTVALSGDGADEVFAGYRKHAAELKARNLIKAGKLLQPALPLLQKLPQSRNTKWGNFFRQVNRFAEGVNLPPHERYWRWASILPQQKAARLMLYPPDDHAFLQRRQQWLQPLITHTGSFNHLLLADMQLVLPGDMLRKVDSMSMANSLEVRNPFLDYRVVNFAFSLPTAFKIDRSMKKRIVQDAFRQLLPAQLYNRPKQGFEVPVLQWLKTDLKPMLNNLLQPGFLQEQGIFYPPAIHNLLQQLYSANPADSAASAWALLAFQHWWKRYFV
ncbi:asparagine synthase (glutamine-hydrolyzing) [Sphingobacteriales bacterium UPWRP_1]|nr:asparagine synthase (glutamine-hydrolyzing) [Sphingobacteriales bacterium TSM_CSM]PSJ75049.1 asparagine synthase (glutamine-hydrolyzing) [Sphingobacteriales bacterium UPWRP_1]